MKVRILSAKWTVCFVDEDTIQQYTDPDMEMLGCTLFHEGRILIRRGLAPSVARATIIHEVTHATIFSGGYKLQDEEDYCDFIGANLYTIAKVAAEIQTEYLLS